MGGYSAGSVPAVAAPSTWTKLHAAYYTSVAAGAIDTKGSYVQIVASTATAYTRLLVGITVSDNVSLDIALGAALSEVVVVPDLGGPNLGSGVYVVFSFALNIPAGSRIAVRCQSSTGAFTPKVCMWGAA